MIYQYYKAQWKLIKVHIQHLLIIFVSDFHSISVFTFINS